MKKKQKENKIIYSKPSKLLPFVESVDMVKANVKKFDEKLFHLQNKIDFTQSMSRGVNDSPEMKKLEDKKITLKERRKLESEYVLKTINSIITTFKDIQISDEIDIKDIKKCIEISLANSKSEADKGAILSNIFTLQIDKNIKNDFYSEVEKYIAQDKEILTGFLMHTLNNDENRNLAYSIIEPANEIETLFKNSINLRAKDKKAAAVSDIILSDRAYLEKLFAKVGKDAKYLEKIKGLSNSDRKTIKQQYFKYRVETNTKPKLGSSVLTYTAKVPAAATKIIKGTFSIADSAFRFFMAIGTVFSVSVSTIISAPFVLTEMGLEGLYKFINKNRTYKEDMKEIYKDLTKVLKRNGQKFKYINDLKVNIDENRCLSINGVMYKKRNEEEIFEVNYTLPEGEYKNFKNIMNENFKNKQTGEVNDFEVGQGKKKLEIIRFMRRIAEVTKDDKNVRDVKFLGSFEDSIQEINYAPSKDYNYEDENEDVK